jgi:glycosyltransferase involved in cell wall biosynthesis
MKKLPLVSFVLICYNNGRHIQSALLSALNQDYPNMEIIISDDCSTDETFELANEIVNNHHCSKKIIVNKNKKNLGILRNLQKAYSLSRGSILINAAGDDISDIRRTAEVVARFESDPEIVFVSSNAVRINELGENLGLLNPSLGDSTESCDYFKSCLPVNGCTVAISRQIITSFPAVRLNINAEDNVLKSRGHLIGRVSFINKGLVYYRIGSGVSTEKRVGNFYREYAIFERKDRLKRLYVYKKDAKTKNKLTPNISLEISKKMRYEILSINLLKSNLLKSIGIFISNLTSYNTKDWVWLFSKIVRSYFHAG